MLFYALEYVNVFLLLLTQSFSLTFFSLLALQGSNGFPGFPGANGEKGTRVRKKKIKYMHTESLSFPSDQGASYILKGHTYD